MAEGLGGVGRWVRGVRHAPLQLTTGQRGIRRINHLWHNAASATGPQLQKPYSGITLSFVVKVSSALSCRSLTALLTSQHAAGCPMTSSRSRMSDWSLQLAVLWFLRRRVPKAVPFLELTSLGIPLTEALARWRVSTRLVLPFGSFALSFSVPRTW